jgi:hypothetical protein
MMNEIFIEMVLAALSSWSFIWLPENLFCDSNSGGRFDQKEDADRRRSAGGNRRSPFLPLVLGDPVP